MTGRITASELVSLALYVLGGEGTVVDTEDVAVRVQQIAPGRFSWRKYPDQINLELVRVALSDARKPENGAMVTGTGRRGWSLTIAGQRWARRNIRLVGKDLSGALPERKAGSIDEARRKRERARVIASEAWMQWSKDQSSPHMTLGAVRDLFRIDRYVNARSRELKVNRLLEMFGDDAELAGFLRTAAAFIEGDE